MVVAAQPQLLGYVSTLLEILDDKYCWQYGYLTYDVSTLLEILVFYVPPRYLPLILVVSTLLEILAVWRVAYGAAQYVTLFQPFLRF